VFIDNEPTKDKGPINWAKEEQLKKIICGLAIVEM
jgi:hypothetical protein